MLGIVCDNLSNDVTLKLPGLLDLLLNCCKRRHKCDIHVHNEG